MSRGHYEVIHSPLGSMIVGIIILGLPLDLAC